MSARATAIRPFEARDAAPVARLVAGAFAVAPGAPPAERDAAARVIEQGYRALLLDSDLWRVDGVGALVVEGADGRPAAFLGAIAQPMRFGRETIDAAVSFSFVADPGAASPLANLQMLKRLLSGPQRLTFTDGANDAGLKTMAACRGEAAWLYSLTWRRVLRPARAFLEDARIRRPRLGRPARLAAPFARVADGLADRAVPKARPRPDPEAIVTDCDQQAYLESLEAALGRRALAPRLDPERLRWRVSASAGSAGAPVRLATVRARDGARRGGFAVRGAPGETVRVLDLHAAPCAERAVVDALLADAWSAGAAALEGRLDPPFWRPLSDRRATFGLGQWTVAHSDDADLMRAVRGGGARLGFFEGEASVLTRIYEDARAAARAARR